MLRQIMVGGCILAVSVACDESTQPEQPPPLPAPTADQVGLPENYATQFDTFYVFDRPDNRQVRVVYANAAAVAGRPYAHGSVLVMETYRADTNAQGVPIVGTDGRYQRGALTGIFVMRKEKWFGRRYGEFQTGEWEYASFLANKTPNRVGDAAAQACAVCHLDAGQSRDWVYRANIHDDPARGALPQPRPGQPANQPFILNYMFVPDTITVPVGTTVTWKNDDEVKHTVTGSGFSGLVSQGATFPRRFDAAGTYSYTCAIHPNMRAGAVVVQAAAP